jgi:hypothetical protein
VQLREQTGAYGFVCTACDLVQINQLDIAGLDHHWP